jgi:type VI secretion system secreted protein Hcp
MAVDYFLKLDGIKGESADAKHKEEIDIESWSWGESNAPGSATGRSRESAGKVSMQDFNFMMRHNQASPQLMQHCASGKHIKLATFTSRKAGKSQQEYLTFKFYDVLVSSYQTSGSEGGDDVPFDSVSINFAKIEVEYKPQNPDGTLGGGVFFKYDLKKSKG